MALEMFQKVLSPNETHGDIIKLTKTEDKHWGGSEPVGEIDSPVEGFAEVFNKALLKVNDQQVDAEQLMTKMATDPKSVELHSVMIASEKARMSLTFAKTVIDNAVKTYKELINLR